MNRFELEFINFTDKEQKNLEKITSCIADKDFASSGVISVKNVTKQEISELNQSFSGDSKPTDVLSFSYIDSQEPAKDTAELGDIAICKELARQQSKSMNIPLLDEYAFLTIHGALHIFGFDHATEEDQVSMQELQEAIMQCAGFGPRPVFWHE